MATPRLPEPDAENPRPGATPTADAAELWLGQVRPLLDAIAQYLRPATVAPPRRAGERAGCRAGQPDDGVAAAAPTLQCPATPRAPFAALSACPAYFSRARRDGSRCDHAHVEILVRAGVGPGRGGRGYGVRVVNVDLPRARHRDAFIAPEATWPDRPLALAAGLRLARERWGEIVVVHRTSLPGEDGRSG